MGDISKTDYTSRTGHQRAFGDYSPEYRRRLNIEWVNSLPSENGLILLDHIPYRSGHFHLPASDQRGLSQVETESVKKSAD